MNRIVGNVLIVDSAMGNALILTSANQPVDYRFYHANEVAFWSSDTTGRLIISSVDTTNHLVSMGWTANGSGAGFSAATQHTSFGQKQTLADLKIPTLTAGTAWIYLC